MPEEYILGGSILPRNPKIPLREALVGLSLPLPGEIATTDVSTCGNEGAWVLVWGSGWAIEKREQPIS